MKLTELTDEQVKHLCAVAQGCNKVSFGDYIFWVKKDGKPLDTVKLYDPINNKAQAMDMLIEFGIAKDPRPNGNSIYRILKHGTGSQLLKVYEFISGDHGHMKAICLAVIASVWGDDVPDELLEGV